MGAHFKALNKAVLMALSKILENFLPFRVSQPLCANLSTFPLQGKAEEQSQNILGWEEKSKQPITAIFDFANLPCPEGETLKGSVNTVIVKRDIVAGL